MSSITANNTAGTDKQASGKWYDIDNKYSSLLSWSVILLLIVLAYIKFPLSSPTVGDEDYYADEVAYLSQYGVYNALSQGTSVLLSLLIFLFSKLLSVSFLVGARILSIVFFTGGCAIFHKLTRRFGGLSHAAGNFALLCFGMVCYEWLWKCLADIISVSIILGVLYLLAGRYTKKQLLMAGLLLMAGFAVKPLIMMTVPGFVALLFLNGYINGRIPFATRAINILLFLIAFGVPFIAYHIPGYITYHKLMLEDKDHHYEGPARVTNHTSWVEKNVYFEVYNVNKKPNKWMVSWAEVDSFKAQHPEIDLNLSPAKFRKQHFGVWSRNVGERALLNLPYSIQSSFFFSKWTAVNRFVKNITIIRVIALLLVGGMYWRERKFVRDNAAVLAVSLIYYLLLCMYVIPQLEDNWLIFCMPLLSIPVVKFLERYIPVLALLALQLLFILL